jgi:hypothetical protein
MYSTKNNGSGSGIHIDVLVAFLRMYFRIGRRLKTTLPPETTAAHRIRLSNLLFAQKNANTTA